MKLVRRRTDAAVADILRKLFPGPRLVPRLMAAFARGQTSVEDIVSGRNVPADVALIVEILAECPADKWPLRWRRAAGISETKTSRILALHAQGIQACAIADAIGTDAHYVYAILSKHSLAPNKYKRAARQLVARRKWCIGAAAALAETGVTDIEVANFVGCSTYDLQNARNTRRMRPKRIRRLITPKMRAEMDKMHDSGVSVSDIASHHGLAYITVYNIVIKKSGARP